MFRSALLLCGGIIVAACFACAQAPVPPPPPVVGPGTSPNVSASASPACSPGTPFPASRIVDLANTPFFSPKDYADCGLTAGGNCSKLRPIPGNQSPYATMIAAAINQGASTALHNHLCSINYIYIDSSTDPSDQNADAWGMREVETDQSGKRTVLGEHIGIRASLLSYLTGIQGTPGPFASYETLIIHYLLDHATPLPPNAQQWVDAVSYSTATSDPGNSNPTMGILGILGHEMGHILWVSKVHSTDPSDPVHLDCSKPGIANRFFYMHSWPNAGLQFGYHSFGVPDTGNRPNNRGGILEIQNFLKNNNVVSAATDLIRLYQSKEWASLFATVSVDEDFVETYMLHELNLGQVPLTSLVVSIPPDLGAPPVTVDVMQSFVDPTSKLHRKAEWIDKCVQ